MTEFEIMVEIMQRFTIDYEIDEKSKSIWFVGQSSDEPTEFCFDKDGKVIAIL